MIAQHALQHRAQIAGGRKITTLVEGLVAQTGPVGEHASDLHLGAVAGPRYSVPQLIIGWKSGVSVSGTSRVVLVVEDEWLVRQGIVDELRTAGWQVIETGSAEAAMACLRAGKHIDVIFTDIHLSGHLSGWDLAERCRAVQPDIPIIYTSGDSVDRSRSVQGSLFFDKPYECREVVDACKRFLDR